MSNRKDWIRMTSGMIFRDEKHYLVSHAMRWKVDFDQLIDRERMQRALESALHICPFMGMGISQEEGSVFYVPDSSPVFLLEKMPERLGGEETGGHLFCLAAGRRSLDLAVYHGLTDMAGMKRFFEALLAAYFDEAAADADPDDKMPAFTRAADPLDMNEPLPDGYILKKLLPEDYFRFPKAIEKEVTDRTYGVFSLDELQFFCKDHNCSVTAAMAAWISMAIQRVHRGNRSALCLRCPVDSRKITGPADTFTNASLAQVLISVDAQKAGEGRIDELVRDLTAQIKEQTDRERIACFNRILGDLLRNEDKEKWQSIADIYKAPVVFSYCGHLEPEQAARHIIGFENSSYGAAPWLFNLIIAGKRCFLTSVQTISGNEYLESLKELMGESGVGISWIGRLAAAPRFMDRMARIVKRYGERMAIVDSERSISYADLDMESGRIYHYLKRMNVGRESMVQIVMPRCAGFFSCIAGVLRAGAAFVPLEDTYPAQRIAYIREDAGCACVLDKALYEQIMADEPYLGGYEISDVHDACYAVYTSGSTGNPKGVLHEYGSLDAQALQTEEKDDYPVSQRGMMASFYFAAAIIFGSDDFLTASTIHIVSRDVVRNLKLLARFIEEQKIEKIFMTPSYVRMYHNPAKCLKEIIVAGEPASQVYYPGGVPRIHNAYGMSEIGYLLAGMDFDRAYDIPPIGRPLIAYEDLHLQDEEGRRITGPGEGELCSRNLYFRGYINLPEKTAHTLRDGVLHTNDLTRRDEKGVYYVVGRLDDMFKINGNRIEPAEIERRLREATGLEQVIAKGFTDEGHAFICAYFLKEEAERLKIWDGNRLTCNLDSLHVHLPDYMIPSHYMALDEFPHNQNGKLVRNKLPRPKMETFGRPYTEPEGEKEKLFCSLMEKALHLDRVGAEDDFYEIGGDSMGAVVFLGLLADNGLELPLSTLYQKRTARALAKALEEEQTSAALMRELADAAVKKALPIMCEQEVHLRQLELEPDALIYNIPQLLKLKKGVDLKRLCAAIDKVFRAHPALISFFKKTDGDWYQVFDEGLFKATAIINMTDEDFEEEKKRLVLPHRGFDTTPHRRAIYHTDSADYIFWDLHHSIADGSSVMLLQDQVWFCYDDPNYRVPEDYYPFFHEQIVRLQRDETDPVNREAGEYYATRFDLESAGLVLKPDLAGPDAEPATITGHREQERTKDGGSSVFLAATAMAVAKMNGGQKAIVYTTYNGRDQEAKRKCVGMLASTVPVYIDLGKTQTAGEILREIRDQLDFGMAHCAYPFDKLHPAPSCNTVLFNYQKGTMGLGQIKGIVDSRVPLPMGQNDMVVTGLIDREGVDALTWYCGYNSGWYSKERMENFHAVYKEAVGKLLAEDS